MHFGTGHHIGHIHGAWPIPYEGYPYGAPSFYSCPSPYPGFAVAAETPSYLCIAASNDEQEIHTVAPWGYPGHDGGQWTFDYIDAENWALENCLADHGSCYITQCFSY